MKPQYGYEGDKAANDAGLSLLDDIDALVMRTLSDLQSIILKHNAECDARYLMNLDSIVREPINDLFAPSITQARKDIGAYDDGYGSSVRQDYRQMTGAEL